MDVLGMAIAVDFVALMTYVQLYPRDYPDHVVPTRISPSFTQQAVVPDYQNPRLLPFREYMNANGTDIYPVIYAMQSMYGTFYQYAPIGRYFHQWSLYEPRPMEYKYLYPDFEIQDYLNRNPQTLFFADYAFDSRDINLANIVQDNVEHWAVSVDRQEYNSSFLNKVGRKYDIPKDVKREFYSISLDQIRPRIHRSSSGWEYIYDLPKNFPSYLSTTVFTYDYASWKLTLNDRILDPMQGELTTPYTYDVQNIQDKKLTILLPDKEGPPADIKLQVKLPNRILNIWKNTYDDLGLTYEAPHAGWLVFHYPFDNKWDLTIDGHKTTISLVNRYFIGAPISGGTHKILLRYWPHTHLRLWIFISMVLSTGCFFGIMVCCIKREPYYQG